MRIVQRANLLNMQKNILVNFGLHHYFSSFILSLSVLCPQGGKIKLEKTPPPRQEIDSNTTEHTPQKHRKRIGAGGANLAHFGENCKRAQTHRNDKQGKAENAQNPTRTHRKDPGNTKDKHNTQD